MSCKNCGSPFHEIWDCKKPPKASTAVRMDVPQAPQGMARSDRGSSRGGETSRVTVKAQAGTQAPPVDTKLKDTRKTDRHKPGYQARKQKEYRDRKRLGK